MRHSVKLKCLKMHWSFLNLIGHGVVMEVNRKMTGCLQTYGGHCIVTRGPRGPWVAHLRKRSKATVETIIENPRGIMWTTLVEDLLMMLYIKYESTGHCSFRQRDFWKFHFKTYLLTRDLLMQPTGTVWTLIGDHPGIIPVKFGQIPISSSREDVVWSFPYIIQALSSRLY